MMMHKSDTELEKEIHHKLISDPDLDNSHIHLSIKEGKVTLRGTLNSYWDEYAIEFAVKSVEGVKEVVNVLNININERFKRTDADIENSVIAALYWDADVPKNAIQVSVKRGCVTLRGRVDNMHQCNSAEKAIRHFTEVESIINLISFD